MNISKLSQQSLNEAILCLKKGGVVICPTDTVYGFLADAGNKKAVDKIYKIKKRPKSKPLSLFVANFDMASKVAFVERKQVKFWPGKVTVVLRRKPSLKLHGLKKDSVAIRIPKHAFLQKLLKKINRPLAQTSVNISTQVPLNSPEQIFTTFKKSRLIGLIINGGSLKNARPSKIVDLTKENIVRLR